MTHTTITAGRRLVFDSRLPHDAAHTPIGADLKDVLNKGGLAKLVLPKGHMAYDAFLPMRTLVEIRRNGKLRFRGRALPPVDDSMGCRTVECEGELCFLNDAAMRPYNFTGSPEAWFHKILDRYNATVNRWKQFLPGQVTVTAPEDITMDSRQDPESCFAALSKLMKLCGGYLVFTGDPETGRYIHWLSELTDISNQTIRMGANLLDSMDAKANMKHFATQIVPYGAEDENGQRLQLSFPDGRDYVADLNAQKKYGIIEESVIYEDISSPLQLFWAASRDLARTSAIPEVISLTAIDLSAMDSSLDAFHVGQLVRVEAAPRGYTGLYMIQELKENLLQAGSGTIKLTREGVRDDCALSHVSPDPGPMQPARTALRKRPEEKTEGYTGDLTLKNGKILSVRQGLITGIREGDAK